jgi:hypothetical protein
MPQGAPRKVAGFRFDGTGASFQSASVERIAQIGFNVSCARAAASSLAGVKYERTADDKRQHIGLNRKAGSAMIAKIPLPLARHIAAMFSPRAAAE